jgi:hypothetical protein
MIVGLTISGCVTNIIVVERAAAEGVHVTFRDYVRVGIPLIAARIAVVMADSVRRALRRSARVGNPADLDRAVPRRRFFRLTLRIRGVY